MCAGSFPDANTLENLSEVDAFLGNINNQNGLWMEQKRRTEQEKKKKRIREELRVPFKGPLREQLWVHEQVLLSPSLKNR